MGTEVAPLVHQRRFGETARRDGWWIGPLVTGLGLGTFVVYSTFRAFYNADYVVDTATSAHILSPFFSPLLIWDGMPSWLSPAFLILWAPGGFRVTCYYYRKAYYRAFFLDPAACAVGEPRNSYLGETRLLLFQNLHRYFLYLAIAFIGILSYDVVQACIWPTADGGHTFGVSVATLVLAAATGALAIYTFSCHSFRHIIGGKLDCFSCARFGETRYTAWKGVSLLNEHHMTWAWISLFAVGLADLYVWMIASGTIPDARIF